MKRRQVVAGLVSAVLWGSMPVALPSDAASPVVSLGTLESPEFGALRPIIGSARVVGLAEFMHLQPEWLRLRNRLFRYLVENEGVTAIAMETSFTRSIAVDDYVQGRGPDTASPDIVHSVFAWAPHEPKENRQLIEWMREYNARPSTKRPIRFYGIDLTGVRPAADIFASARETIDYALRYVARVEPGAVTDLLPRIEPCLPKFSTTSYSGLSQEQRDRLTAALSDLEARFEQRRPDWERNTATLEFQRAHRSLRIAMKHDADFRAKGTRWSGNARDAAMAENVEWVLEREGAEGRILLCASMYHLTRAVDPTGRDQQLGAHLAASLRKDYVAIGSYWLANGNDEKVERKSEAQTGAPLRLIAADIPYPVALLNTRTRHPEEGNIAGSFAQTPFDALIFIKVRESVYAYD